jgi:hypothetical protein
MVMTLKTQASVEQAVIRRIEDENGVHYEAGPTPQNMMFGDGDVTAVLEFVRGMVDERYADEVASGVIAPEEIVRRQLAVCVALAPNARAQEHFANVLRQSQAGGENARVQVECLVSALLDGLQYGNWGETTRS